MGRMIDIDLHFMHPVGAIEVIQSLLDSGLSLTWNGSIRFHLTDDFDWKILPEDDATVVLELIKAHAEAGDTVGIDMYFDESPAMGSLVICADSTVVYFILPADRVLMEGLDYTEFNWYLARLIPALSGRGISGFVCNDFYPR